MAKTRRPPAPGVTVDTVHPDVVAQVMSAFGRMGGRIGGKRRLETLTPKRRTQIAREAAQARWAKPRAKKGGTS